MRIRGGIRYPDPLAHQLVRLDIVPEWHRGVPRNLRLAHCTCGAWAEIKAGQGHVWITLHRYFPQAEPGVLATVFGIE
jgi:hypothetical protein